MPPLEDVPTGEDDLPPLQADTTDEDEPLDGFVMDERPRRMIRDYRRGQGPYHMNHMAAPGTGLNISRTMTSHIMMSSDIMPDASGSVLMSRFIPYMFPRAPGDIPAAQ